MSPRQLVIRLLDRLDQTGAYADLLFLKFKSVKQTGLIQIRR